MTSNPPKEHNFDVIPTVHHLDEFFHQKFEEDEATHTMKQVRTAEEIMAEQERNADKHIHMPSPSYWPIVLAFGLPIITFGLIYSHLISVVGGVIVLFAAYGWALESSTAPDSDFESNTPGTGLDKVGANHD
jgi:cytochrome c oxidase subunit 1